MEYISHEDYKNMMGKFQTETPKGKLLKEGHYNDEDAGFVEMISDELVKLFKAGKISNDQWNDADDYLNDHGYELWVDAQTGSDALGTILQHVGANVKEGNAFTAGLAKAKKGQEFKVDGKTVKDTSNYDAPIKEADGNIEKLKQEIKTEYGHGGNILSFANSHDLGRIAKISSRAAKALESLNNMMPEDLDIADLKPNLKAKVEKIESSILKDLGIDADMLDEKELDEYQFDQMYPDDPGPFEGKNFMDPDESYFTIAVADELDGGDWGLSPEQLEAAQEYLEANYYHLQGDFANNHEVGGGSGRAAKYIVDLIKKQGQDMDSTIKEFLMKEDDVNWDRVDDEEAEENETDNGIEENVNELKVGDIVRNLNDEDVTVLKIYPNMKAALQAHPEEKEWVMSYFDNYRPLDESDKFKPWYLVDLDGETALEPQAYINKIEEGLNPAPFQATGPTIQTVETKHNVAKLKPEERDQLKQYVETIKTVKEEISKMLNKTKMKEGGDNTNLIMKPTTVSEDDGGHDKMEDSLGEKLHGTFYKVTDMAIKQLVADGWDVSQAASFLKVEIEERAKEAMNAQYDPQ
jgi:hypothetical protein